MPKGRTSGLCSQVAVLRLNGHVQGPVCKEWNLGKCGSSSTSGYSRSSFCQRESLAKSVIELLDVKLARKEIQFGLSGRRSVTAQKPRTASATVSITGVLPLAGDPGQPPPAMRGQGQYFPLSHRARRSIKDFCSGRSILPKWFLGHSWHSC